MRGAVLKERSHELSVPFMADEAELFILSQAFPYQPSSLGGVGGGGVFLCLQEACHLASKGLAEVQLVLGIG